jgi:Domain of unknown function (DUF4833)
MKKSLQFCFAVLVLITYFCSTLLSQETDYPEPKGNNNQLFYLQRAKNTNTVVYEVNEKDGILDKENPINYYWIMYNEKGQKEPLTDKEISKAYGLKVENIENDKCDIGFISANSIKMCLEKGANKKYQVVTKIKNKKAILKRIFLEFKGVFWSPKVKSVYLEGKDLDNNTSVNEKLIFD